MAVPIRHRVIARIDGIKRGGGILRDELSKTGTQIGKHLQTRVRQKQRVDTGQERSRTLWQSRIQGAAGLRVSVYNTVVQALVDETGARWTGSMPPSHPGSRLFNWVSRKGFSPRITNVGKRNIRAFARDDAPRAGADRAGQREAASQAVSAALSRRDKDVARIAFLVARKIARRGLPRPGDPLRMPFARTTKEESNAVKAMVGMAVARSVTRINNVKRF